MTNIEKIKAEIERRRDSYLKVYSKYGRDADYIAATEDLRLLEFLDTLESEKEQPDFPTTNDQVKEFLATHPKVEVPKKYKTPDWIFEKSEKPMNPVCESKFKVGDVIQFKDGTNQYKICGVFSDHYINSIGNRMDMSYTDANFELVEHPVCEGLEEELDKWRHDHFHGKRDGHFSGEYLERTSQLELAHHFAKWQKEQMMKEAVCYIAQPDITATGNIVIPFIRIGYTALSRYGIKVGDKVRVIIVKEDEK